MQFQILMTFGTVLYIVTYVLTVLRSTLNKIWSRPHSILYT
jgi:hypothetical protein